MSTTSTEPPPATLTEDQTLRLVRQRLGEAVAGRSIAKGVGLILLTGSAYVATWVAIFYVSFWPLKILLGYLNGLTIGMLFIIGHDACHMGLTPVGWLNRLLGRLVFLPAMHPYAAWEYSHNGLHHGWTNLKQRDPGFSPFTKQEFDALPRWRQWLERAYRTGPGLTFFYLIENWVHIELFPSASHRAEMRHPGVFRRDQACVLAFGAVMATATVWLGVSARPDGQSAWIAALGHLAVAWVMPFLVFTGVIAFITFQQHTHPRVRWFDNEDEWSFYDTQIRGTVHIEFPWYLRLLLHNINEHTAHHINPRVPLYGLKGAQTEVREMLPDDVVVLRWSPRMTRETLRCCKLYDYREHRWLDFDGRPTGESLIAPEARLAGAGRRRREAELSVGR